MRPVREQADRCDALASFVRESQPIFNIHPWENETRIKDAGGQIINGPMQVPGERWIVQGLDPQGAMFALLAGKR